MLSDAQLAEIRSRINPAYRDWPGCDSHERDLLVGEIDRLRAQAQADAMQLVTTGGQAEEHWAEVQRLRKVLQAFAGVEDFAGWHDKYQPAIALARAALADSNTQDPGSKT